MKRKIIYSLIFLCAILFLSVNVYAINKNEIVGDNTTMGNMVSHVDNGIDHTKNAVKDMEEGAKNVADDMKNGVKDGAEKTGNAMKDAGDKMINVADDAKTDVEKRDASSSEAKFMGMSANTILGIIMIAIAVCVIILIVKCMNMKNDNNHNDKK